MRTIKYLKRLMVNKERNRRREEAMEELRRINCACNPPFSLSATEHDWTAGQFLEMNQKGDIEVSIPSANALCSNQGCSSRIADHAVGRCRSGSQRLPMQVVYRKERAPQVFPKLRAFDRRSGMSKAGSIGRCGWASATPPGKRCPRSKPAAGKLSRTAEFDPSDAVPLTAQR
jgi:hypothetical protein